MTFGERAVHTAVRGQCTVFGERAVHWAVHGGGRGRSARWWVGEGVAGEGKSSRGKATCVHSMMCILRHLYCQSVPISNRCCERGFLYSAAATRFHKQELAVRRRDLPAPARGQRMVRQQGQRRSHLRPDLELERGCRQRHVVPLRGGQPRQAKLQPPHRQLGYERRDNHREDVLQRNLLQPGHRQLRHVQRGGRRLCVLPAPLQPSPHPPSAPASPCPRLVCAFAAMFQGAESFNQDISAWDMSSVEDAEGASSPRLLCSPLRALPRPPASPCSRLVCACRNVRRRGRVRPGDCLLGLLVTDH